MSEVNITRVEEEVGDDSTAAAVALPPIEDVSKLATSPIIHPDVLVHGLFHKRTKIAVGGPSKAHKTWLLAHLAFCVSHGLSWLGFRTNAARVLFVNFEILPSFFTERLMSIASALNCKFKPDMLDVWNLRGYAASHDNILPRITEQAKERNYGLIILDPSYKMLGEADENSAHDVAQVMNSIEGLSLKTGAATAFATHFAKGNASAKEPGDRMSGSGVFLRDPDTIITFTTHEEDSAFTVDVILRNFPPVEPFVVKWVHPLMRRDDALNPANLKPPKTQRRAPPITDEQVTTHLRAGKDMGKNELTDKVMKSAGRGHNAVEKKIKAMLEARELVETSVPREGTNKEKRISLRVGDF